VDSIRTITQVGTQAASVALEIQSVLGALLVSRMTTTQKLALTPANGMMIYDITLNEFSFYEAGAWVIFLPLPYHP